MDRIIDVTKEFAISSFQDPILPFRGFEPWSRRILLPVSRISLHVYDTGEVDRPPVLLLHGLGDDADTWRHVLPLLHAGCRVIAPDLPGFGRSELPKGRTSIPALIDAMLELLDLLGIRRVRLAGHSLGAMIAQALAMRRPERVEKLVLISGSLVASGTRLEMGTLLFLIPGVGEWMYTRLRKSPQAAYATLQPYYYHLDGLPQADRDFLFQRVNQRVWSDDLRRGYLATLRALVAWLPAQQKAAAALLPGWSTPTAVVWGEADRLSPVANARALAQRLPSARLEIIPEAGHNLPQEKADQVAAAILS